MLKFTFKNFTKGDYGENVYILEKEIGDFEVSIDEHKLVSLEELTTGKLPHLLLSSFTRDISQIPKMEIDDVSDFQKIKPHEVKINKQEAFEVLRSELNKIIAKYVDSDEIDEKLEYFLLKGKIDYLRTIVEEYDKNKNSRVELEKKSEDIKKKIEKIDSDILSIKDLLDKKQQIIQKLTLFKVNSNGLDLKEIKNNRSNFILKKLKNFKKEFSSLYSNNNQENFDYFVGEGLLILSAIQVIILISLILKVGLSLPILIFSLLFVMINVLSTLYLNVVRFKDEYAVINIEKITDRYSYETIIGKLDPDLANDIKSLNLIAAMQTELKNLDKVISSNLGSKTFEELNKEKVDLEDELNSLSHRTNKRIISQEEYYRFKRELEISTIELESIKKPEISLNQEQEKRLFILSYVFYNIKNLQDTYLMPIILLLRIPIERLKSQLVDFANSTPDAQIILVNKA